MQSLLLYCRQLYQLRMNDWFTLLPRDLNSSLLVQLQSSNQAQQSNATIPVIVVETLQIEHYTWVGTYTQHGLNPKQCKQNHARERQLPSYGPLTAVFCVFWNRALSDQWAQSNSMGEKLGILSMRRREGIGKKNPSQTEKLFFWSCCCINRMTSQDPS